MVFRAANCTTKVIAVVSILVLILPYSIGICQEIQQLDYYYEGQDAAKRKYRGTGAFIGGLVMSGLFPFIGYGVGALIVVTKKTNVPRHYLSEIDSGQALVFEIGYKDYVKKKRLLYYNIGGGIVTAFWLYLFDQQ